MPGTRIRQPSHMPGPGLRHTPHMAGTGIRQKVVQIFGTFSCVCLLSGISFLIVQLLLCPWSILLIAPQEACRFLSEMVTKLLPGSAPHSNAIHISVSIMQFLPLPSVAVPCLSAIFAAVIQPFYLEFTPSSRRMSGLIELLSRPDKLYHHTLQQMENMSSHTYAHIHTYAQVSGPRVLEFLLRISWCNYSGQGQEVQEISWAMRDLPVTVSCALSSRQGHLTQQVPQMFSGVVLFYIEVIYS